MDESCRRVVLRALAQASIAVSEFSTTMRAASDGDEGAVVYRSLSSAPTDAPPLDADAYGFLKNPPPHKIEEYFKNVENLADTVCALKSSIPSDKTPPDLINTIDEASTNWLGYEMCVTALGNVKKLQDSLADDSGDGCPICMEQFVEGAQFTTVCGHKFCSTCWDGWKAELIGRILTCPLCRKGQPVTGYNPSMLQLGPPSTHGGAADSSVALGDAFLMFGRRRDDFDDNQTLHDQPLQAHYDDEEPVYRSIGPNRLDMAD